MVVIKVHGKESWQSWWYIDIGVGKVEGIVAEPLKLAGLTA